MCRPTGVGSFAACEDLSEAPSVSWQRKGFQNLRILFYTIILYRYKMHLDGLTKGGFVFLKIESVVDGREHTPPPLYISESP